MAEAPASRPRFFLDEQRNDAFVKRLGERSRFSVLSDAERQSAAAIRAVLDDDEDDVVATSRKGGADCEEPASHVVDLEDRPDPSTVSATKPATLWSRLQTGWEDVEDRLAEWFGLDQSKYQWAVDELLERQLAGEHPASKADVNGPQMQNVQEQSMQEAVYASLLTNDHAFELRRETWKNQNRRLTRRNRSSSILWEAQMAYRFEQPSHADQKVVNGRLFTSTLDLQIQCSRRKRALAVVMVTATGCEAFEC